MARNKPVKIWITKHSPRRDPKFHQIERLFGAGRSIKLLLIRVIAGWDFRNGCDIDEWAEWSVLNFRDFYYGNENEEKNCC